MKRGMVERFLVVLRGRERGSGGVVGGNVVVVTKREVMGRFLKVRDF